MQCRYCGAHSAEEDHRCLRCGRRLHMASARPAPDSYTIQYGAAVPDRYPVAPAAPPESLSADDAVPVARPSLHEIPGGREEITRRAPYQPSLFATREPSRVVAIGGYGAAPALAPRRPRARVRSEEKQPETVAVYQQTFEWTEPARRRQAAQEAVRYSDAPVATPMHRAAAAVLDYSLVLIAVGLVMSLMHMGFGELIVNRQTLPYFAVLAGLFAVGYKLLWAMAGMDSPGLRWVQLQSVHFDGRQPARNERMARVFAGCLSVLSGGLGLLWSLADEETLSWHDHMSKTFLTLQLRQEPGE